AWIYFKGVPVMGTPYLSFPLSGARKSGVLPPSIGSSSRGGLEIMVPYYFNIAPNRDFTLSPRYIAKRGMQLGGEARYLGEGYAGETSFQYLSNDRKTKTDRYFISTLHNQTLYPNGTFGWNINAASDNNYPRDFSRDIAMSSNRLLPRNIYFSHQSDFWSATVRATNYQVLQDYRSRISRPYDRLPQLILSAARQDVHGFDLNVNAEATRFSNPDDYLDVDNRRLVKNLKTNAWELLTPRNGDRYH